MSRNKTDLHIRQELAQNAAKLIAVEGINDFLYAKKKAAEQLGILQSKYYPSNREIENALIDYQQLFQSESQPIVLKQLRDTARKAMKLFSDLEPYLTGPVLNGTANIHSEITLHIYTDTPEQIDTLLIDHKIPFEHCQRRAKFKQNQQSLFPAYQFFADRHKILLIAFPERQKNHSPLNVVDNHPEKRATLSRLESFFQQSSLG